MCSLKCSHKEAKIMKKNNIVYRKLAARMTLLNVTKTEVARMLGISYSSLQNKLCGVTEFTLSEALYLRQLLWMTAPIEEAFEKYEGA